MKKLLKREFLPAYKPGQVCTNMHGFVSCCVPGSVYNMCATVTLKGRKKAEEGGECVIIILLWASPEHCVNMDTMEMHQAIMAGFMHFSPAGRTGGERKRGGD